MESLIDNSLFLAQKALHFFALYYGFKIFAQSLFWFMSKASFKKQPSQLKGEEKNPDPKNVVIDVPVKKEK